MEPDKLLQAQAELIGLLREPIRDVSGLKRAKNALSTHCAFITHLSRVAGRRLGMPLETIFQCLMQMSADISGGGASASAAAGGPADFDCQHRDGAVPMHQAKVLRRDSAREVEPLLRDAVKETDEWNLPALISHSVSLRTLLRIKVEDGNDLSMARRAITQADDYMTSIFNLAQGDDEKMYAIFMAEDENALARILGSTSGGVGGELSKAGNGGDGNAVASASSRPLPQDLARGIEEESRAGLADGAAVPVGTRQRTLADIDAWLRMRGPLPDNEARAIFAAPSFRKGMHYHLAEKRSALLRAACDVLSLLLARSSASALASEEAVVALTAWAAQVMTQVHVTVAAIATATDGAMRDMIVATGGMCLPILQTVSAAMARGIQPELHRKALGYGALALATAAAVSQQQNFGATRTGTAIIEVVLSMLPKGLGSSTEGVRRNARVAGLVIQLLSSASPSPVAMPPQWDARVEKAAAALTAPLSALLQNKNIAAFEVEALLYAAPCSVAAVLSGIAPPVPVLAAARCVGTPSSGAPVGLVVAGSTAITEVPWGPDAAPPANPPSMTRATASSIRSSPPVSAPAAPPVSIGPTTTSAAAIRRSPFGGLPCGGIALTATTTTSASNSTISNSSPSASLTPLFSPAIASPNPQPPSSSMQQQRSPKHHHQIMGKANGASGNSVSPNQQPSQNRGTSGNSPPSANASFGFGGTRPPAAGVTAIRASSKSNSMIELGGDGGCGASHGSNSTMSPSGRFGSTGGSMTPLTMPNCNNGDAANAAIVSPSQGAASSRSLGGTIRGVPLSLASLEDAAVVSPMASSTTSSSVPSSATGTRLHYQGSVPRAPSTAISAPVGLSGSLRRRLQQQQQQS